MNAKGQPCKRRCAGPFCQSHEGEGIIGDAFHAAKKALQKVTAPIARRITALKEGPAKKPTGRLNEFLNKTQGLRVVKMELGRKPILNPVKHAMDVLSLGKFSKTQKTLNYDSVYHQYTLFTLSDGSQWKLEKNHVVEAFPAKKSDYDGETWEIPIGDRDLTLRHMVDTASRGHESEFWKYRAGSNNCQRFTRDMIERNGLLPDELEPHHHVQDAGKLADSLPSLTHGVPNLVTDIAAVGDRLIHGDGIRPKQAAMRSMLFGRN